MEGRTDDQKEMIWWAARNGLAGRMWPLARVGDPCFRHPQWTHPASPDSPEEPGGVHTAAWPGGLYPRGDGRTRKGRFREPYKQLSVVLEGLDRLMGDLSLDMLLEAGLRRTSKQQIDKLKLGRWPLHAKEWREHRLLVYRRIAAAAAAGSDALHNYATATEHVNERGYARGASRGHCRKGGFQRSVSVD
ncbi:hypothetical protein GWK47_026681 [Chionoecetes opilio]|uniref:Uncharacterized protein n=1 Tax=Chionoecetes opilio TaxID=41210 RepID=A0A8J8WAN7_CHIOP|nr:hypothetical protein GWK47_026681 [Chionoecetes opilio]